MNKQFRTIRDVETWASENGIMLTPADRQKIASIQKAERERLEAITPSASPKRITWADKFNAFYPKLIDSLLSGANIAMTFAKTVMLAVGIPAVLVGLLIVEHHRVYEGITLFDKNGTFASIGAIVFVVLNLLLELNIHHIEHKSGYQAHAENAFSLRLLWSSLKYKLGLGSDWQPKPLSPAERQKRLSRWVTMTILVLALLGSMKDVIAQTEGAWYTALISILTDSDLLLMGTWVAGLLVAFCAVLGAQVLARFVSQQTVEVLADMIAKRDSVNVDASDIHAEAVEFAGANTALALIQDKLDVKAQKAQQKAQAVATAPVTTAPIETVATLPETALEGDANPFLVASQNGNGHYHNGNGKH